MKLPLKGLRDTLVWATMPAIQEMSREVGMADVFELRKFVAPEFVFGVGARHMAGRYAKNLGGRKILVVSDPGVVAAGWTKDVTDSLEAAELRYALFTGSDIYSIAHRAVTVAGAAQLDIKKVVSLPEGYVYYALFGKVGW